jgi:hypothetical protein
MLHLCLLSALALLGADEAQPASTLEKRLLEINAAEAKQWDIYIDEDRKTTAKLIERPVYYWTNPTKGGGQFGSVFLWTHEGRPIAAASVFAHPDKGNRRVVHELHALSENLLRPECRDGHPETWEPKAAIKLQDYPEATAPDASLSKRLLQMRKLGRAFGGHTVDWRKQRWELRLLPQPLFRYEKTKGDITDGALFALVTDAGTDPEILLLLEATKDGWRYGLMRFTDSTFHVRLGEREVFAAVRGTPEWAQHFNPDHTYRTIHKRNLTEDELGGLTEETQP